MSIPWFQEYCEELLNLFNCPPPKYFSALFLMTAIHWAKCKAFYPGTVSLLDEICLFSQPRIQISLGELTSCMKIFQSTNDYSSFCPYYKGKVEGLESIRVDESRSRCYRKEDRGRVDSVGTWDKNCIQLSVLLSVLAESERQGVRSACHKAPLRQWRQTTSRNS